MKFPIGIQDFRSIRQGGFVYVDKTGLVYRLAQDGKVYFLSRPRRFRKSLLVSTLKYYFSGEKDLFKAADQDLRFVLLTGVTKFSQVSMFSGFNQPEDISMNGRYDAICGIASDELENVFSGEMDAMAEELKVTPEEIRQMLNWKEA